MNNDLRIKKISEFVEQLATGKYELRLTPSGIDDDLDVIVKNLNVMAGNLHHQQSTLSRVEQNVYKLTDVMRLLTPLDLPDTSATEDIWNTTLATVNALTNRLQSMTQKIDTNYDWFEEHIANLLKSVEQIPCIIMITNARGDIEYVNNGFTKITGYSPEEVMGKNPRVLNSGKQSQEFYKRLWSSIASGSEWRGELVNRKKNGELYWESASLLPIKNSKGVVSFFLKVAEDITEYKELDKQLKKSKQDFNAIMEKCSDGVLVVDLNGIVQFANHSAESFLGRPKAELINDMLGIPAGSDSVSELNVFLENGKKGIAEMRVVETEWKSQKAFLLLLHDITERKRTEEVIIAEKERLAVTLQSLGDGVVTTDTEGKIVLINKVSEELTGWPKQDAIGKPLPEVFGLVNEKTHEPYENMVEKVIKTGKIVGPSMNTMLVTRDGAERAVIIVSSPILDNDSNISGVVLAFRDVTKTRKMEEELLKTSKLDSLGILAGGIAHDFNNFLTAIMGNVQLTMMNINDTDNATKWLNESLKASMRARDLTHQLLTFSKGGIPVKATVSIWELIKESAEFALRGSNIKCEFFLPGGLLPVHVDINQITQVINNLVINADQAMPQGGSIDITGENITVKKQSSIPVKEGEYIKITIKDSGVGIPKELLTKIFDPYFTTKQKGSGLGLATSYSIIKNHEGLLTVESEPGVGTSFDIYLPASSKKIIEKKKEEEIPLNGKGKVLIMDDDDVIIDMTSQVLKNFGYETEFARDGAEAIELYKKARDSKQPFDVALFDLTIPGGMGGKEAIKKLLEIDPDVKAIVSSGYSDDPVLANFKQYGFKDMVPKPYDIKKLIKVLSKVIKSE